MSTDSSSPIKQVLVKLFQWRNRAQVAPFKGLPGPPPVFPVGNADDLLTMQIYERLYEYSQTYGEMGVFWVLSSPRLFINSPELIERVLVTDKAQYYKLSPVDALKPIVKSSIFIANEPAWSFGRKNHPFSSAKALTYYQGIIPATTDTTKRYMQNLGASKSGRAIDLHQELVRLAFNVFSVNIVGFELGTAYFNDYLIIMQEGNRRMQSPLRIADPRFRGASGRWYQKLEELVSERQKEPEESPTDILGYVAKYGTELPISQLCDELFTIFLAGAHPVATTLASASYLLTQYPDLGQRLIEEIDAFVLNGDGEFSLAELDECTYLNKFVKETLRLYPTVAVIARATLRDGTDLNGYSIPQETEIYMSSWALHHTEKYWADPFTFDPERFSEDPPPFHYFPFGAGERSCVGEFFALTCIRAMLVTILAEYSIEVDVSTPYKTKFFTGLFVPKNKLKGIVRKKGSTRQSE